MSILWWDLGKCWILVTISRVDISLAKISILNGKLWPLSSPFFSGVHGIPRVHWSVRDGVSGPTPVLLNHRGFVAIRMLNQVELSQRHPEMLMFFVVGLALPRSEVSVTICGAPGGKGIPLPLRSGLHGSAARNAPVGPARSQGVGHLGPRNIAEIAEYGCRVACFMDFHGKMGHPKATMVMVEPDGTLVSPWNVHETGTYALHFWPDPVAQTLGKSNMAMFEKTRGHF